MRFGALHGSRHGGSERNPFAAETDRFTVLGLGKKGREESRAANGYSVRVGRIVIEMTHLGALLNCSRLFSWLF